jgi:hypothetical protein
MIYGDGSTYSGEFVYDVPHGEGHFEFVNKDKYVGNFQEGKKEGRGTYYFSEGTVFNGIWNND